MPKLIDYADRYEAVREVVYEITLEQGVGGISTAAVAERLHVSSRTLQRLVASAEALPLLGLQRAERLARNRFHRRAGSPTWARLPEAERALTLLLDELPGNPEREDRQVYWALLFGHGDRCDWARSARLEHAEGLATLSAASLAAVREDDRRAVEVMRLRFLVTGAIGQVFRDPAGHAEAERIIRGHVTGVLGTQGTRDDAA
jgi:AcrR family transcriptional regulator